MVSHGQTLSFAHYRLPRPSFRHPGVVDELLDEALAVGAHVVVAALEILVVLARVAVAEVPSEPHGGPKLRVCDVEALGRALEDVLQMVGVAPIALDLGGFL